MDSGFYAACAGLVSRMEALDVLSNNLANTSTDGYKAEREFYSALQVGIGNASLSPLNQAMNRYGVIGGQWLDLQRGAIVPTGNTLDLALQGSGFFTLQKKNGVLYTRNGNFRLNAKRQLIDMQGNLVLGPKGAIRMPAGEITVSANGTISVNGAMVGKLRIVNFKPGTVLTPSGNTDFTAPPKTAVAATNPSVRQGALEASNMNAVSGVVSLILAQRSAQMMEKALNIFDVDFDKTAQSLGQA